MLIDRQLGAAGWVVQDKASLNLFAGPGVAVREVVMAAGHGRADYLLYVDKAAVGVIEAKPEGTTLSGVEWQSARYAEGLPPDVRLKALTLEGRLPGARRYLSCHRWRRSRSARPRSPRSMGSNEASPGSGSIEAPEVIAREIVEDLTAALAEFEAVAAALEAGATEE